MAWMGMGMDMGIHHNTLAPPEARSEGRVNIHEYHGSFAICRDP